MTEEDDDDDLVKMDDEAIIARFEARGGRRLKTTKGERNLGSFFFFLDFPDFIITLAKIRFILVIVEASMRRKRTLFFLTLLHC